MATRISATAIPAGDRPVRANRAAPIRPAPAGRIAVTGRMAPAGRGATAQRLAVASRAVAAIAGGYALAALAAIALGTALPLNPASATIAAMLAGLLVMPVAAMACFRARSAARAWGWLAIAALSCLAVALGGGWRP